MAVTITQLAGYPKINRQSLTAEDCYLVRGAASDLEAQDQAAVLIPGYLTISELAPVALPRADIQFEPLETGSHEFLAKVQYGNSVRPHEVVRDADESSARPSFSVAATVRKFYYSKKVVRSYGRELKLRNWIGVSSEQFEGVDVAAGGANFTVPAFLPATIVSSGYIRMLTYAADGHVTNLLPFAAFNRGEVAFLGANGSQRKDGDWQVEFQFAVSPAQKAVPIYGPQSTSPAFVVEKGGWEYIDINFLDWRDAETAVPNLALRVPIAVRVHRIFEEFDFRNFKIPAEVAG